MPGGRLTTEDRRLIADGLAEGLGYAEIGRRLDRPASTVMREVTRNGGPEGYRAHRAEEATRDRARRGKQAPARTPAPRADDDGAHGRDPGAVREFTESYTDLLEQQGLPRMMARVQACLYSTDSGALTAAELVQRLRVSPASVSHAVAFLEQQGMLRRERPAGSRRERYVIDDDFWYRSLTAAAEMNDTLAVATRRGADVFGADTPAGARFASSVELLVLLNKAFRQVAADYRRTVAERGAGEGEQAAGEQSAGEQATGEQATGGGGPA
ncbi:helix-turn-helix domain-containing protein [Streptomyces sp. NPDC004111]|uniref:GbsR/MarR family transcriptional regulator n=1 Tax=Streptomyces sp. NPDC004111 TaxID=3364690 RepID=UPI0036BDD71A